MHSGFRSGGLRGLKPLQDELFSLNRVLLHEKKHTRRETQRERHAKIPKTIICKIRGVTTAGIVGPDHSSKNRTHALIVLILKNTIRDKSSILNRHLKSAVHPLVMTVHDRSRVKTDHDVGHDVAQCVQPMSLTPTFFFLAEI